VFLQIKRFFTPTGKVTEKAGRVLVTTAQRKVAKQKVTKNVLHKAKRELLRNRSEKVGPIGPRSHTEHSAVAHLYDARISSRRRGWWTDSKCGRRI